MSTTHPNQPTCPIQSHLIWKPPDSSSGSFDYESSMIETDKISLGFGLKFWETNKPDPPDEPNFLCFDLLSNLISTIDRKSVV